MDQFVENLLVKLTLSSPKPDVLERVAFELMEVVGVQHVSVTRDETFPPIVGASMADTALLTIAKQELERKNEQLIDDFHVMERNCNELHRDYQRVRGYMDVMDAWPLWKKIAWAVSGKRVMQAVAP